MPIFKKKLTAELDQLYYRCAINIHYGYALSCDGINASRATYPIYIFHTPLSCIRVSSTLYIGKIMRYELFRDREGYRSQWKFDFCMHIINTVHAYLDKLLVMSTVQL